MTLSMRKLVLRNLVLIDLVRNLSATAFLFAVLVPRVRTEVAFKRRLLTPSECAAAAAAAAAAVAAAAAAARKLPVVLLAR